jgi:hypothetical protein
LVGLVLDPSYESFYRFKKIKGLSAIIIKISQTSEKRQPLKRESSHKLESINNFLIGAAEQWQSLFFYFRSRIGKKTKEREKRSEGEKMKERRGMVSMREMEVRCDNSRKGEKGEKMKKKMEGIGFEKKKEGE